MPRDSQQDLGQILVVETLSRMDAKLDKLDDRLDDQGRTLVSQQAILDEHVRRTNLLEEKIEADKEALKQSLPKDIQEHLKAERKTLIINGLKILGVLAGLGGGGFGLKELLAQIHKFWGS